MNDAVQVSERDRDRLLELISEYAQKLRAACDIHQSNRLRFFNLFASSVGLLIIFGVLGVYSVLDQNDGRSMNLVKLSVLVIVMAIQAGLIVNSLIKRSIENSGKVFGIAPVAAALEKLVSRAAFLEDHTSANEDERLIIALRVAEGEAALEYAASVLPKNPRMSGESGGPTRRYRSQVASL